MRSEERTNELCRIVYTVVSSIADDVSSISVVPIEQTDGRTIIQVQVAAEDRGKVLGRDGRIANAIRQYVKAYRLQHGGAYSLDIVG